jgi:hypothetical protein
MFGWFKRNKGFEWHDYVRTTILLRRQKRRERLAEAGHAAARGVKDAGRRGAAASIEGVQGLGRGAVAAGQQGAAMSVAGASAAREKVRIGLAHLWAGLGVVGRSMLRQPHIRAPLAIVGFAAIFGAVARIFAMGFDLDVVIAMLIGLVILGLLFMARLSGGVGWSGLELRNKASNLASIGPAAIGTAVVGAVLQRCMRGKSRRWNCGASATAALSRLIRRAKVSCEITGSDDNDRRLGDCRVGDKDIAAQLVRGGHVFATAGFFAPYTDLEEQARKEKLGIWRGQVVRPSDYRAQKWEEAKRAAPNGCPIKGNVSRGRRVYVLPWARGYERVKITRRRGERWFCSETEAQAAGWKPAGSS